MLTLMTEPALDFFVIGAPQTAGSKTGFKHPTSGRVIVTESGNRAAKKTWRGDVRDAAAEALVELMPEPAPEDWADYSWPTKAPLAVRFTFVRRRPASHYGSGRNMAVLKPSAPAFPTTRPDVLKLARAVEDALTEVLWHDDSQIVIEELRKEFGEVEGVRVEVTRL